MDPTTMHPNARRTLEVIQSFGSGDFAAAGELFAEGAVWHAAGRNPHSGDHRGEAIGAWFQAMGALKARPEPVDIMADDTHVAFFLRVTCDEPGHELDQIQCNAWRFEDGRAVEGWFLPDDQDAWDRWTSA